MESACCGLGVLWGHDIGVLQLRANFQRAWHSALCPMPGQHLCWRMRSQHPEPQKRENESHVSRGEVVKKWGGVTNMGFRIAEDMICQDPRLLI